MHIPADGSRLGTKCEGTNQLLEVYWPIPAKYHKIDVVTRKDKYKNV